MTATGSGTKEEGKISATAERFCRRFSLAEVQLATQDFSEAHLIGIGGFGKVYKGQIDNGQQTVAMKRLAPNSNQGEGEFLMEIETLSKLQHVNLVSLIGYCNENGEMILVYEYIPRGTLADHLYKHSGSSESDECSSLTWKQRLNICIGAGRGLDYLHTGTSIIHRDVKSTNILLGENFVAKVSDFGLARHLSTSSSKSYVSTIVKGSFGYLDPSYFITCRLTRKSDTYAFGVVLLEVLCGRPAVDPRLGEDEMSLVMWAREKISKGKADQLVASNLRDEMSADCLKTFVGIVKKCLNHEPKKRPTMAQVVVQLEFALEQQDKKTQTQNASRFLPFWNRVKPSGSSGTGSSQPEHKQGDVNTLAKATQEEALNDKQKDHRQFDAYMLSNTVIAIPIQELKDITCNFSSKCLIGGKYGARVYSGALKSGQVAAIKIVHYGRQRDTEFLAQVTMVSSLKHANVARLLGYCADGGQQFLAYEFAPNGSLHDILHGSKSVPALSWSQRVNIAMGAAKGLEYIHEKSQIHYNIKSSNILLFDDYQVAKLADFGLPIESTFNDVEDFDAYRARHPPECMQYGPLSWRTDVYDFGVVLLQLLTGGKLFDYTRARAHQHIVNWATSWLSKDSVNDFVDAKLNGDYPREAAAKMAAIAASCLENEAESRPDMSYVVSALRPLLKQHRNVMARGSVTKEERKLSSTAEEFCRRFSLAEVQLATEDFSEAHLNGSGGFGEVYRGQIDDGQQNVAIKRLAPNSKQGEDEFMTEIETLSKLRHGRKIKIKSIHNA